MSDDCIFCKIKDGEIPCHKVYEDENVLAFLDINPQNPGHTLLIPKKHSDSLLDADEETLNQIISAVKKVAKAVKNVSGGDGVGISQNNGAAAGQSVFHLHFHIIPRFEDDGLEHWPPKAYKSGEAEALAKKLSTYMLGS